MGKQIKKSDESMINSVDRPMGKDPIAPPPTPLEMLLSDLNDLMVDFTDLDLQSGLTGVERRRLNGSGVRRYGFIDKVSDFAVANPDFIPPFMDVAEFKQTVRDIELFRNISVILARIQRIVDDQLLLTGDKSFNIALMYYNAVRDAVGRKVPGALVIFNILRAFFRRPRRPSEEVTNPIVERDAKALLEGHKSGKVVIENVIPQEQRAKRVVVDDIYNDRDRAEFKDTEEM